jgi:RimJ/RimL family protein N-acetyltransferase
MKLGNIKLRELELSDKLKLSELLNNKKIWDNLRNKVPYPYQESDAINFIEFITKDNSQQVFAIEVNGNLCGVVGLVLQQDVYEKSAEIGYWIGD